MPNPPAPTWIPLPVSPAAKPAPALGDIPRATRPALPPRAFALWEAAFRPFFLFGSLLAVLFLPVWIYSFLSGRLPANYYGFMEWHRHEMLFGFGIAAVAGFLLTAVATWTKTPLFRGKPLIALTLLWVAGRIAPFLSDPLPGGLIAAIDLLFIPATMAALAAPLIQKRQLRNYPILGVLAIMFAANILVHLGVLGVLPGAERNGSLLQTYLLLVLIAIIGGRVIPFFVSRAIPSSRVRGVPALDLAAILLTFLAGIVAVFLPLLPGRSLLYIATALVHFVRLAGWLHPKALRLPLLWVLHAGYAWLGVGFLFLAATPWMPAAHSAALHAFTAGAIGVMILGIMARVALGHSGRILKTGPTMLAAFWLVNIGALLRTSGPLLVPALYRNWLTYAGLAWALSYLLFLIVYSPILLRPRADAEPG